MNKAAKIIIKILLIVISVVLILCFAGIVALRVYCISKTEMAMVDSPNGEYTVVAYRSNGGATTGFLDECYLKYNKKHHLKRKIYSFYPGHSSDFEIEWLTETSVEIDGVIVENVLKDKVDIYRDEIEYQHRD